MHVLQNIYNTFLVRDISLVIVALKYFNFFLYIKFFKLHTILKHLFKLMQKQYSIFIFYFNVLMY